MAGRFFLSLLRWGSKLRVYKQAKVSYFYALISLSTCRVTIIHIGTCLGHLQPLHFHALASHSLFASSPNGFPLPVESEIEGEVPPIGLRTTDFSRI
jgi:hypothetical protein